MKITKFFALLCAAAVGFVACEPVGNTEEPNVTGKITLSASKTTIELGETVTFKAEMKDAETGEMIDVTEFVSIYDSELNKISNPWTPTASGNYTFNATYGAESSNNITISVMAQMPEVPADPDPENLAFNHRVVVIDHTGVGCPNCPLMTDNLRAIAATDWHKHYNEVTCHAGGYAGNDPASSQAATALNQTQSPNGYPTLNINFNTATVGNYQTSYFVNVMSQTLEQCVKKSGADVGIAMAVEGDNTNVYCAAQIKAKTAKEYKAVAWLLESGIYSPNQAGATKDYHKIYNHALRNMSHEYSKTNVQGDAYTFEANEVKDFAFELPIISTKWNYENMEVLVVVSAKDANGRWEVANSSVCKLNEQKEFEYVM